MDKMDKMDKVVKDCREYLRKNPCGDTYKAVAMYAMEKHALSFDEALIIANKLT